MCEAPKHIQGTDSTTWKGVCHEINLLNKGVKWRIGKGDKVRFWSDNWHPMGILKKWALRPINEEEEQLKANNFLEDYGWNFQELKQVLPREVIAKIVPIHAERKTASEDSLIWGVEKSENFTVRSEFELCCKAENGQNSSADWKWNFIWKLNVAPKIKTFLWTIAHGKIMTNMQRVRRQFTNDASCPICSYVTEDLNHVFRFCENTKLLYQEINRKPPMLMDTTMNFKD